MVQPQLVSYKFYLFTATRDMFNDRLFDLIDFNIASHIASYKKVGSMVM